MPTSLGRLAGDLKDIPNNPYGSQVFEKLQKENEKHPQVVREEENFCPQVDSRAFKLT